MKIYIVNLPRCQDRRENILRECARYDLEAEIVPGVDGAELGRERLRKAVFEPDENPLSPGEVGCALGHLDVYGRMEAENIPAALILEDDGVIVSDPRPLLAAMERLPAGRAEAFLLTRRNNLEMEERGAVSLAGLRFPRCLNGVGANGYVLTLAAARNIRRFQTPIKTVADDWKTFLLAGVLTFRACEREIIGHPENAAGSLIEAGRRESAASRERRRYLRKLRRRSPLPSRLRYLGWKLLRKPFLAIRTTPSLDGSGGGGIGRPPPEERGIRA